jgi:GNAT superfamily N-acetyltransferase
MKIEASIPADSEQVAEVIHEAASWLEGQGKALWRSVAITTDSVSRDVEAGRFIVARENDRIVGVVRFQLEDAEYWPEIEHGSSAYLHRLAIRRAFSGQGVSRLLLGAGVAKARSMSRGFLRLDCVADREKLRQLYEGYGFVFHSYRKVGPNTVARYEVSTHNQRDSVSNMGQS